MSFASDLDSLDSLELSEAPLLLLKVLFRYEIKNDNLYL